MKQPTKQQQSKIKDLTWKYFWQRKRKEGAYTVGGILGAVFLPYWVGLFMLKMWPVFSKKFFCMGECSKELLWNIIDIWTLGFVTLFVGVLILAGIGFIIYGIVSSNWNVAKKQAYKETTGNSYYDY